MVFNWAMGDVSSHNFGLLIAYIVPGFVVLLGISCHSETVRLWLGADPSANQTIGGFLHSTVAAVGAGMLINAVRWHTVDLLHHLTGVPKKNWDYSQLPERIDAFRFLVGNQFRYYEFYSNTFVASAIAFTAWAITQKSVPAWLVICFLSGEIVLWSASRRTLSHYLCRTESFLRSNETDRLGRVEQCPGVEGQVQAELQQVDSDNSILTSKETKNSNN